MPMKGFSLARRFRFLLSLVPLVIASALGAEDVTPQRVNQADKEPHNWLTYGGTYRAWRYSPLDQVNVSNIQKLAVAWAFQFGDVQGGLQCTPLVADGVMYVVGPNDRVFALDAATGKKPGVTSTNTRKAPSSVTAISAVAWRSDTEMCIWALWTIM